MKIPNTTTEKPYIEFRFDKSGKLSLSITDAWWSGKNGGFTSYEGDEEYSGNSCKPKDLDSYIKAYKQRKVKLIEKEISNLQKQLQKLKKQHNEN